MDTHQCPDGYQRVPDKFMQSSHVRDDSRLGRFIRASEHPRPSSYDLTKMELLNEVLDPAFSLSDMLSFSTHASYRGKLYEALWDIVIKLGFLKPYSKESHYYPCDNRLEDNRLFAPSLLTHPRHVRDYLNRQRISTGNSAGISDITLKYIPPGTTQDEWVCATAEPSSFTSWVLFSVKYFSREKYLSEYDIQDITELMRHYQSLSTQPIAYKMVLLVRDKRDLHQRIQKSRKKHYIDNVVDIYDETDLQSCLNELRRSKETVLANLMGHPSESKPWLNPRFHQQLFVNQTLTLLNATPPTREILWGQMARSGKTYTAGLLISSLYKNNFYDSVQHRNITVVITPAPTETLTQFTTELFEAYQDFQAFTVIHYSRQWKHTLDPKKRYLLVVSKQYLQGSSVAATDDDEPVAFQQSAIDERCKPLRNRINLLFFDEVHHGGSTALTQSILQSLDPQRKAIRIYLTATYRKPIQAFQLHPRQCLIWDMEDLQQSQFISDNMAYRTLCQRHDESSVVQTLRELGYIYQLPRGLLLQQIEREYQRFPNLHVLTAQFDADKLNALKSINTYHYGYDMNALFELHSDKKHFINDASLDVLLTYIASSIYPRMAELLRNYDGDRRSFQSQLWFLPFFQGNRIRHVTVALAQRLDEHPMFKEYAVMIATETRQDKHAVKTAEWTARAQGKRGLIVLVGKKFSLGISLPCVDAVFFLNNDSEIDTLYQRMFRALTESPGKRIGFLVDLNPFRTINALLEYVSPTPTIANDPKTSLTVLKRLIENRVIYLDDDLFYTQEMDSRTYTDLYKRLEILFQQHWLYHQSSVMEHEMQQTLIQHFLNEGFPEGFVTLFDDHKSQGPTKFILESMEKQLASGRQILPSTERETDFKENIQNKDVYRLLNMVHLLNDILFLMAFFFVHEPDHHPLSQLSFEELWMLLTDAFQDSSECNEGADETDSVSLGMLYSVIRYKLYPLLTVKNADARCKALSAFLILFTKRFKETNMFEKCNRQFQALKFMMNVDSDNSVQLHQFVEKYLPPKEREKKEFGEVFTPLFLVQEMLGAIETHASDPRFWTNPKMKILDPAAGIGNFPLIAFEKLMVGLQKVLPNEEARKRHILEQMLVMVELNPNNVRILKRIFNGKKYKLTIIQGDALDPKTQAKVSAVAPNGFQLIMGNPPYQDASESLSGTLWDKFIQVYMNHLSPEGYLVFVTPSGWRNLSGKFKNLQNEMLKRQMMYLEIHNEKDGMKVFKSETRYDWYVLKNIEPTLKTLIQFQSIDNKPPIRLNVSLKNTLFIPNAQYKEIHSLFAKSNQDTCQLLYDTSYHTQRPYISKTKSTNYKYPIIYTIDSESIPHLIYSQHNDAGHFGVPKLIWSNGRITSIGSYLDLKGMYGLSQFAYAIVDDPKHLPSIKKAFDSPRFRQLMESCAVGQLSINHKVIAMFRKDFWKQFL